MEYPLTEDSKPQDGVPQGEVLKFTFAASKIFPGTTREYWVYVPKQYDPAKPACVFVCQDGVQYSAPVVFDNLIAKGEMPVTIGVFIMHGKVVPLAEGALPRFNRSLEYDGLGLMLGVELLEPATFPPEPATQLALAIIKHALRDGLLLLADSPAANILSLTPPFTISDDEIAFVAARLQEYLTFLPGSIS